MGIEVLTSLDKAKTQWYHFTAIIVAGMGFFTDAYDLFCISTVSKLLGRIYYYDPATGKPGTLPATVAAVVNGIALCGALVGQLFFGWLGDKLGRKKVYGLTLMCMVISSIASGLSFGHSAKSVMATLCFFRFWLGFGIGGDYPLSATIMSEYANTRTRGAFIAAVFAMQGFGILAGGVVSLVMSAGFKAAYPAPTFAQDPVRSTPPQADYMWRFTHLALVLSAVAGSFAAPAADPNIDTTDAPDFELNGDHLMRRQDYNQNYKTSGTVNFSPTSNGYSVSFSNAGDFVVGKGWKTGTTRSITFSGSTTASAGTVLVSVYGWTTNPLIEYYVQEYTSNGAGSAQGTKVGTVTCDGSVYDIWKHQQVNQPSIQGTSTFWQYISNRQSKRPGSGTVTTKCHFDAWKALGLNLGTHNYQTLSTEGWGNAGGSSQYTVTGS